MEFKTKINKQEFIDKLIKSNCKFKRFNNIYLASCKQRTIKYIAVLIDFHNVEVYQLNDDEANILKIIIKMFATTKIEILRKKNENNS